MNDDEKYLKMVKDKLTDGGLYRLPSGEVVVAFYFDDGGTVYERWSLQGPSRPKRRYLIECDGSLRRVNIDDEEMNVDDLKPVTGDDRVKMPPGMKGYPWPEMGSQSGQTVRLKG